MVVEVSGHISLWQLTPLTVGGLVVEVVMFDGAGGGSQQKDGMLNTGGGRIGTGVSSGGPWKRCSGICIIRYRHN